jgi:hypothetical protein
VSDATSWAGHSLVSSVGAASAAIERLPADPLALRAISSTLVFHYREDGDFAENGIAPERVAEVDTRYADLMFDRLRELGGDALDTERPPASRLVGCCRDFTLLYVAMAREKGIPARSRVGFATYFAPGWFLDHVVAEVWDEGEHRWRLVESEVSAEFATQHGFDPMDVPRDVFLTGGAAWLGARAGEADPERFVVAPGLDIPDTRGWRYLRHNLVHDLAALNKHEMVLWDQWGIVDERDPPGPEECTLLDDLAALVSGADPSLDAIRSWGARDGLAVPPHVRSYSPAGGFDAMRPVEVSLRQP